MVYLFRKTIFKAIAQQPIYEELVLKPTDARVRYVLTLPTRDTTRDPKAQGRKLQEDPCVPCTIHTDDCDIICMASEYSIVAQARWASQSIVQE